MPPASGTPLLRLLRGLACAALLAPGAAPRADFESAVGAVERGDYRAAFLEIEPLARAGDVRAQDALATLYLRGLAVERDVRAAMSWYCLVAHHAEGGPGVMQAVWYLAEWFRTGGGVPGRHYNDGKRADEDPIRAYFWFSVMADQKKLYDTVHPDSVRLGKIGRTAVGALLFESEREDVAGAVAAWRPEPFEASPKACLDIPAGVTAAGH